MEKIEGFIQRIPNLDWVDPLGKEFVSALKDFTVAIHQVNTSLWLQGFLAGFGLCATVLTSLWCFSKRQ